jgi:putative transposase
MPRIGTRKLHYMLASVLQKHGIAMGRDYLFDLLAEYGLLIRKRKRIYTTNSNHPFFKYPNLIRELYPDRPDQLWVSDITYISLKKDFCYLSLVTDAYSKKIIGQCLHPTLQKEGPLTALQMAIDQRHPATGASLIHHSDRGMQYCCMQYTSLLKQYQIRISMTEKGDPYENAIAERVNGILKTEFLFDKVFDGFENALAAVNKGIHAYNQLRPHASCNYLTPAEAHQQQGALLYRWKPKKQKEVLCNQNQD